MSYSAESLARKLGSLKETQDSIVSVSQWVLFHHRHSKESAKAWADYLTANPHLLSKKLTLLYLSNEVVQQARHKRKTEFLDAYFEVLPAVLNLIYKELDAATQAKVERLVDVWNQRNIFNDKQIAEMKKAIKLSKASKSLSEGAEDEIKRQAALAVVVAPELKYINDVLINLAKLEESNQANLSQVGIQSKSYLPEDPAGSDNLPSPKVYISKLNILEKLCNASVKTLKQIETQRNDVLSHLATLQKLLADGVAADGQKLAVIESKKLKLIETRSELLELLQEETESDLHSKSTAPSAGDDEEASPTFESVSNSDPVDDDDDIVPQYEGTDDDSEDSDDDRPQIKRQKVSPPSQSETHIGSMGKAVAFSDDVEVREYVKEDGGDAIRIIKSDSEGSVDFEDDAEDESENDRFLGLSEDEDLLKFESKHKDALDLKHDHDHQEDNDNGESTSLASSVLDLLSKLA